MSRRRLLSGTAAVAAAALLPVTACTTGGGYQLICRHQRSHEVYADIAISAGTLIRHSWIHSIELSRWTDTFQLSSEALMLVSAEFSAYGAGMPLDEGDVSVVDGVVRVENIDREFDAVRWINSHQAEYRISIDGDESLIDPGSLPDHEPLELKPQ